MNPLDRFLAMLEPEALRRARWSRGRDEQAELNASIDAPLALLKRQQVGSRQQ